MRVGIMRPAHTGCLLTIGNVGSLRRNVFIRARSDYATQASRRGEGCVSQIQTTRTSCSRTRMTTSKNRTRREHIDCSCWHPWRMSPSHNHTGTAAADKPIWTSLPQADTGRALATRATTNSERTQACGTSMTVRPRPSPQRRNHASPSQGTAPGS